MRTPLTVIQGFLGLLHLEQFGELSDEGRRLLAIALNNVNRLARLATVVEQEFVAPVTLLSSADIEQFQLENDLYQALNHQQFQLMYQPIIEVSSEQILGFEALLRWEHPTRGTISPTIFIPIAERLGIIHQVGVWVLEQACRQLADWQQRFPCTPPIAMNVNLSASQLSQPDLLQRVRQILQDTKVIPNSLKLEITETMLVNKQEIAVDVLSQLRDLGVRVYIDDFGTGYSSLSRLQTLPIDALKIDRSFVHLKQWDISATIIMLASRLGLEVIAEGVETLEELLALRTLGCHQMQGYFFSKPVDKIAATNLLKSYRGFHPGERKPL